MRYNCLTYALDRWHRHGGHLVLRKSDHWSLPHVMQRDADGLHSYVPPKDLAHPIVALFGFEGEARPYDDSPALPVPLRGIVVGGWVLAFTVTWWAAKTFIRRAIRRVRR